MLRRIMYKVELKRESNNVSLRPSERVNDCPGYDILTFSPTWSKTKSKINLRC
jgi:hypothetical protein